MKKILTFILLACMMLTFAACGDSETPAPEDPTPEITLQDVYDAGKNLLALLGEHENVYVQVESDGKVIRKEYLSKDYRYSFNSADYMNLGFEYADFTTDHSEYVFLANTYMLNLTLTPSGMIDMKERFDTVTKFDFVSSAMPDKTFDVIEKDGSVIVTVVFDSKDIFVMSDGVVSCTETYTLDAKTREMTAIKSVYTYENGKVEEGLVTIARDVKAPEGAKPFLAYEKETENLRTVTIVSNPGAENEKTESIQTVKGLQLSFTPDGEVEKTFNMYSDAECTQEITESLDVNSDVTIYIKWN